MVDLASLIRPGDGILWGQACAEPQTLVEALVGERAAISGASVFLGSSYSGIVKPEHADHLRLVSYCGTGTNRALAEAGVLDILPAPYSQLGNLLRAKAIRADVVLLQVSPPNAQGEYSLGLGVEYLAPALEQARIVVAEVNDQVPWTHSEPLLRKKSPLLLAGRLGERRDMRNPVGAAVVLAVDAELLDSAQDDVVAPVRQRLGMRDDTGAADPIHGRPSLIVGLVARLQQRHSDDPVALQRVTGHRPVSRLENVQWQKDVREEDHVRQREDGNGRREHDDVRVLIFDL
jgi:hypothetical protein